jgi:hypothetical protein
MKQQQCSALLAAVVLLVGLFNGVAAGRHALATRVLQQTDALSNSDGCLASIPKCEPGACVNRNVLGVQTWVCLRCLANYEAVVSTDGQDHILQCGELRALWLLGGGWLWGLAFNALCMLTRSRRCADGACTHPPD